MNGSEQVAEESSPTIEQSEHSLPIRHSSFVIRHWLKWLWRIAVVLCAIPMLQVAILRFVNPPATTMMVYEMFSHLFSGERITWSHTNEGQKAISPYLYSAVIAGEDQRFFMHHGFDETEIEQAMRAHARHPNRPERGASS